MTDQESGKSLTPAWAWAVVAASSLAGLGLIAHQAYRLSSTYDEVTYLEVGSIWWRSGAQDSISRMGTPLTSWKVQQAPTLWLLDHLGYGKWIDAPLTNQARLLPLIRIGGSWIWLASLLVSAEWARRLYGPKSMAMTSVVCALEPNLLAHATLSTMEMPLVACVSGMFLGFWWFLKTQSRRAFWGTAALGGLAMSCKFTTILIPPILGLVWVIDLGLGGGKPFRILRTVIVGMIGFILAMVVSNLVVTGFATIPLSIHPGPHPSIVGKYPPSIEAFMNRLYDQSFPQDWIGFATQLLMQRGGAPSYLMGESRMTGWWQYYLVALGVKLPLALWFLILARVTMAASRRFTKSDRSWVLPVMVLTFLLAAVLGSKRNFGVRYMLPVAAPAIVWTSGLAQGGRRSRIAASVGILGMAISVGLIHPHELSYFNELTGGSIGGRKILSDSNLDWGQGLKSLARLQRERPELRDLTFYYFGQADPTDYGVEARSYIFKAEDMPTDIPEELRPETRYLAVSASLQFGPWGLDGYFRPIHSVKPIAYTDDTTIAIYRTEDLIR